jgi:carbon starvation protein
MLTVAIALGSLVLYLIAYHTYGRWLARRVFRIDPSRTPPSMEREDGVDFVPSHRWMVFGHHFTSIAGTGPIVGPAIAVIWGWVPALVWVLVGSIVMGAVHDFGSLMVAMRHRGKTIGDLAGDVVNARVRLLFMLVVLVAVWIVIAIFGLVIANIFKLYPQAVWPTFLQIPIAVGLGVWVRRGGSLAAGSLVAVALMYGTIWVSSTVPAWQFVLPESVTSVVSPGIVWTLVLLAYVFVASVLPVQWLLQPRDYINALQLILAMGLLLVAVLLAAPPMVGQAYVPRPAGAPAMIPFLFITIACGAISGFHCLVSSGCSARQLRSEGDAQFVSFGSMLTEGFLAVLVILACVAGFGMAADGSAAGATVVGAEGWQAYYGQWREGLAFALAPVVTGSANMMERVGVAGATVPHAFAIGIMGVFIASFAATTLDSATRLQRYVISELASTPPLRVDVLKNRYVATALAVASAGLLAMSDVFEKGWAAGGTGGMTLWPVFGATNQLLGGLALLVVTVWLVKLRRAWWVTAAPMIFMLAVTGWAIVELMHKFSGGPDSESPGQPHLLAVAAAMLGLELWIVAEAGLLVWRRRQEACAGAFAKE